LPSGKIALAYNMLSENSPGSHPTEIIATLLPFFAALSTFSKCSGILACVSKLSTTLNKFAHSGVCVGKSFALPPHKISTSILSDQFANSQMCKTLAVFELIFKSSGALRVNTATSSISGFCSTALSTPRPRFP
jgi:hypothetical protein